MTMEYHEECDMPFTLGACIASQELTLHYLGNVILTPVCFDD
jgi:hypothetical protein